MKRVIILTDEEWRELIRVLRDIGSIEAQALLTCKALTEPRRYSEQSAAEEK